MKKEKGNMQENAILEIDHAALALVQAMETNAYELECCMDMDRLEALRAEIVNLRRALLGLEMGMLYQHQDYDEKALTLAVTNEKTPVNQVAAKVMEQMRKKGE
jgi:hypothetical protein